MQFSACFITKTGGGRADFVLLAKLIFFFGKIGIFHNRCNIHASYIVTINLL